jgi:hypothetical protein
MNKLTNETVKINRRSRLTLDFEEPQNLFFKFVNQIAFAS